MAHQSKSGTTQFALDFSPDAKLRFESLHQSMGLRTKAQTFEAILYFVSTKDKIDPAALQRMEKKIDHSIHLLESPDVKNGQIFAHKSTARGGIDLEYLDETSRRKASLRERADMEQQIGKNLKHFTDYASQETLGQVHAGGFLHPASQHPNESRRHQHCALSAFQRRAQTAHYRNLAKASGEISFDCETSRNRSSARFLDVQGTARCTDRCRNQPRSSPSFEDEKGHAKIQREISSQRFDRLRLRPSSRHSQPPRSPRNFARATKMGATWAAARRDPASPSTRRLPKLRIDWQSCCSRNESEFWALRSAFICKVIQQMNCIKSWFELENSRWQAFGGCCGTIYQSRHCIPRRSTRTRRDSAGRHSGPHRPSFSPVSNDGEGQSRVLR